MPPLSIMPGDLLMANCTLGDNPIGPVEVRVLRVHGRELLLQVVVVPELLYYVRV